MPVLTNDSYLYVAAGLLGCYALYLTHSQLKTFRSRCISRPTPSPSASDAGVDQSTEDALSLPTLSTLAMGINFDIRAASLKIITDRASAPQHLSYILSQISSRSTSPAGRRKALRAIRCFAYTGGVHKLCNRKTFEALVGCLHNCLPSDECPGGDPVGQKEALYVVARLVGNYFIGREMLVDAGFVDWLKKVEVPAGYGNVVEAVMDCGEGLVGEGAVRSVVTDMSLWQIVMAVLDEGSEGRKIMEEAGLRPRSSEGGSGSIPPERVDDGEGMGDADGGGIADRVPGDPLEDGSIAFSDW